MSSFVGLQAEMFGVYVPSKWSSNVHNLPRMRNKDTMVALGVALEQHAPDPLVGLLRAASDEIPNVTNHKRVEAQWLYWSRDADERRQLASMLERLPLNETALFGLAAHEKHASIALILRESGLWLGLHVGAQAHVDRRNLLAKLDQSWERQRWESLLADLPEGACITLGDAPPRSAHATDSDWQALAEAATRTAGAIAVGMALPMPEVTNVPADVLVERLSALLAPFVALYRFTAWSRSNDAIDATKQLQAEKAEKRRCASPFRKDDPVRIVGGMFTGKRGVVLEHDATRGQVKVRLGMLTVLVGRDELVAAPR